MKREFIKYSIVVILVTVLALYLNNLSTDKRSTKISEKLKKNNISASVSNIHEDEKEKDTVVIAEGIYFNPVLNKDGSKMLYGNGDNIFEMNIVGSETKQLTNMGGCYNPAYSKDEQNIVFARNNGIYLLNKNTSEVKKVVSSDDPQKSFSKPNFTPEGDIIYFSVTVIPWPEGNGFTEKEPGIFKVKIDGKNNEKIVEGYNPALSYNGKKLAYELKDKIYVLDLDTKENKLIDIGKYAAWSQDNNYISYTKFEKKTSAYTKIAWHKKLYLDKDFSNVWIANINNNRKYKITREEFENKEPEIKEWAKEAVKFNEEQHFVLPSKQSFFDSTWGKTNDEVYALRYSSKNGGFQLVKYKLSLN